MKRVMVFIDGAHLYCGLKDNAGRTDLDFHRFSARLAGPDREMVGGGEAASGDGAEHELLIPSL